MTRTTRFFTAGACLCLLLLCRPLPAADHEQARISPLDEGAPAELYPNTAFIPTQNAASASLDLQAHISIKNTGKAFFNAHVDTYKAGTDKRFMITTLPAIQFDFIQAGNTAIPLDRTIQHDDHPYWEWQVSAGRIWHELDDQGFERMLFPLALSEKNANCTHNGYLLIFYNRKTHRSNGFFQIRGETCAYLKFDYASRLAVQLTPAAFSHWQAIITAYRRELAGSSPPLTATDLKQAFPRLNPDQLLPPDTRQSSVSGVVIKGQNYRLHCSNRGGPDPYCRQLALPSYSTAKSLFAGLALMRLEVLYPGISNSRLSDIIPECKANNWQDVSLANLLNMRSGHYQSLENEADENSASMLKFFLAESNADKLSLACSMFPRKSPPGRFFAYHTIDTYLAGVMLNRLYQQHNNQADIYTGLFTHGLWQQLKLSALISTTKRTYDASAQPFTGYGLTYYLDDLLKIVNYLYTQSMSATPELNRPLLNAALLPASEPKKRLTEVPGLAYNTGFWALDVSRALGCKQARWVAFMSGYGGITVALISPELMYYNFADDNQFHWLAVVKELGHQFKLCKE